MCRFKYQSRWPDEIFEQEDESSLVRSTLHTGGDEMVMDVIKPAGWPRRLLMQVEALERRRPKKAASDQVELGGAAPEQVPDGDGEDPGSGGQSS